MAAEIAQAIFESDAEAIQQIFAAALKKGDARVFTALADRAYGRAQQRVEVAGEGCETKIVVQFIESDGRSDT